jgi:ferritin-like metal-binding protein YciE
VKALPKMIKAAARCIDSRLRDIISRETKKQVERLKEVFALVGEPRRASVQGHGGLIEEGDEVIEEASEQDDAAATWR